MENKKRKVQKRLINANILKRIPSENECKKLFREYKERKGMICPKCGCSSWYFIGGKLQHHRCKNCNYHSSIRSNTIMHYSKLSFRMWWLAMYIITQTKNSISAAELQRQLGHKYYRPVYTLLMKIRRVMQVSNMNTVLDKDVEIDEAFFSVKKTDEDLNPNYNPKKRNSHKYVHSGGKAQIVVMAESKPVENFDRKKYTIPRAVGRIRFAYIWDTKADTLKNVVEDKVAPTASVISDGTYSHKHFKEMFSGYYGRKYNTTEELMSALPYVHIMIGNAKALIRNIHHAVSREYIMKYLEEFSWKFNHRNDENMMETLMLDACVGRFSHFIFG